MYEEQLTSRPRKAHVLAGLCLAGGMLASLPASAAWPHYRELQLQGTAFGGIVADAIDRIGGTMCAVEMPCVDDQTEDCVLERVQSAGNGYFHHGDSKLILLDGLAVTGPRILFTIGVVLDQMRMDCATDPTCVPSSCTSYPACLPANAYVSQQVPVTFELYSSGAEICLSIHEILYGAVDPSLLSGAGVPDEFCFGGELGTVDALLEPLVPGATAVTWDGSQEIVAVRTDYLPPSGTNSAITFHRFQSFDSFVEGNATPGVPNEDWNILLSGHALSEMLALNLENTLASESKLRLQENGSVGAVYLPGVAQASADADAYTNSFCDWVDVAPLWISMSPSLSSDNANVEIHSEIGWSVNGWDVVECIFSNPLGALLAPIAIPIGLAVANNQGPSSLPSFGQLTCVQGTANSGKEALDCTASVPQISTTVAGGSIDFMLTGDSHSIYGWRLFGNILSQGFNSSTTPWHVGGGIGFGVHGGCSSLSVGYHGSATISGPVQVCDVDIVENPHGVYDIGEFEPAPGNVKTAEITFPTIASMLCPDPNGGYYNCYPGQSALDDFWLDPKPMEVRLTTNRGIRTFEIAPPAQATSSDHLGAMMALLAAKIECMAPQTGFLGIPGMYDPRWDIDPAPLSDLVRVSGRRIEQLGVVELQSVAVGFLVSPIDTAGGMSLDQVTVVVEAMALVDAGRVYRIPISFETEMGFELSVPEDGLAHFTQVTDSLTEIDLSAHLPRDLYGAGFSAMLPAGTVEVTATFDQ